MKMRSKTARYGSLIRNGACTTNGCQKGLRISSGVSRWMRKSMANAEALTRLIASHDRSLPYQLLAGYEVVTELDLGDDEDSIFLQSSCGTHPSWERPRASRGISLHSFVAFPSEF